VLTIILTVKNSREPCTYNLVAFITLLDITAGRP